MNIYFHTDRGFNDAWTPFTKPHPIQVTTEDVMGVIKKDIEEDTGIFLVEEKDDTLTVVGIDPGITRSIKTGKPGPYQSAYWVAEITRQNLSRR
jgi:hypothetical protein